MTNPQSVDKYELLEELGHGGFATVYRARDTSMGREVALKVIAGSFAQEPAVIERFRREALTAANLHHPRIVTVYDFGDADGTLYLSMALISEGRTLRDLLAEQAPLPLEQALPILAQLADALDYLHGQNPPLTHRDVKPANVLLEGEGDNLGVVLADFGLVRSMEASTELTKSGTILGTLAYMSPEQANPKLGEVGPAADLYALGVVAYEMLTGRVPFEGEAAALLHAHAYEEPPSPLDFVPDLGDDLSEVLLRALAKSPAERYPSTRAFVNALQEVAKAWSLSEIASSVRTAVSRALAGRTNVVKVRVNDEILRYLDMLVEADICKSRSESAVFLIAEGVKANSALYERIAKVMEQIAELRRQLEEISRR